MYKFRMSFLKQVVVLFLLFLSAGSAWSEDRLKLATTTSTDNSGLLAVLHPPFEAKYNVKVDVIAVGTGKALKLGENGDVDVVMVHAPDSEIRFVEAGFGVERIPVMHNDFILTGSENDPAGIKSAKSLSDAMARIAGSNSYFISRGDDSGTHKKEISLWQLAGIEPGGKWYLSAGQGMGNVLIIAFEKQAYTLSDRGTYLAYRDKIDSKILIEGDKELFNPYHVIVVNPEKHPHVNLELANKYIQFITGLEGQKIINDFKLHGEKLFYPDVIKDFPE